MTMTTPDTATAHTPRRPMFVGIALGIIYLVCGST
jgi:hypothetical protein